MPIRPENKHRYPKDWKLRSRFVREYRAGNQCEWCGVCNHAVGHRDAQGRFVPVQGNLYLNLAGQGMSYPQLDMLSYKKARQIADALNDEYAADYGVKFIVVVLTVAHIHDDRPEASQLLNLAALCQRCHNRHDQKDRQAHRRQRLVRESGQLGLFGLSHD